MAISIDQNFVNGMSMSVGVPTARRAAGNSDATNGNVSRKREAKAIPKCSACLRVELSGLKSNP